MKKKEKTIKNYTFETRDGMYHFKVLKTADGIGHSMSGIYPIIWQTEEGMKKLTRKQTENYCVATAVENGWFPADGNK